MVAKKLSADTVSPSDDYSDAQATPAKPTSAIKRKPQANGNNTPNKRVKFDVAKNGGAKNRAVVKSADNVSSSSEEEEEEEEEEDEDDEADAAKRVNGAEESSSEEEEEDKSGSSEDEEEDAVEEQQGESEEESEREGEDEDASAGVDETPALHREGETATTTDILRSEYQPPPNFSKAPALSTDSRMAHLLDPASLEGKQIWLISAPASVPIADLKSIPVSNPKAGEVVLSNNGNDFALAHGNEAQKAYVLIPAQGGKKGLKYKVAPVQPERHLQLEQVVQIPDALRQQETASQKESVDAPINVHNVRPVVPQLEGLRTRWWPLGFEGEDETAGSHAVEAKPRKKKKYRPSTDGDAAMTNGEGTAGHGQHNESTKKKKKKAKEAGRGDGSPPPEGKKKKKKQKSGVDESQ